MLHPKEKIKQICELMGEDLDHPSCQEILDHINNCPTCKVYYDTVKKTVLLCRDLDCSEELPDDVNKRLLKVLNLDGVQEEDKSQNK